MRDVYSIRKGVVSHNTNPRKVPVNSDPDITLDTFLSSSIRSDTESSETNVGELREGDSI